MQLELMVFAASDHCRSLCDLRPGWIANRLNDVSDPWWRNFRRNLPVLTVVLGIFMTVANALRCRYWLKDRGVSFLWILLSLIHVFYLHGVCALRSVTTANFFLAKAYGRSRYYIPILWAFNITVLISNRKYEGYSFSIFGRWAFLDNHRGTFGWQICYNLGGFCYTTTEVDIQ